ncbi:7615_t:CDS:2 [Cetraspora pellucida]|uniref:7615_t:CDS:1 n=1 Tax=Cetraspora pellucida TaxID=1433469 RepID=A0A9N9N4P8_9GLOM|nr:7615_t:CDS:2 [Cetraspora pellucida]
MHQGQHVLLLLNNCPSHILAKLTLQYTKVLFLPPNNTLKIQPLNAVSAKTIYNCWYHTKIFPYDINAERNASTSTLANTLANTYQKNLAYNDFVGALQAFRHFYLIRVEEFLNIPEEDIVYKTSEDD